MTDIFGGKTGELVANCEAVTDFVLRVPVLLVVIIAAADDEIPGNSLPDDDEGLCKQGKVKRIH